MDELRSWWEVPSIAHFCSLFRSAFDLSDFDIEDLEEALLESLGEDGSEFLNELVCKLLNGCYCRKDITILTYDLYVKDVIQYKWKGTGNPIAEKSTFKELTLREKVDLVYSICEYRLDAEDVTDLLKGFEGDNMRVEPLGKDKDGGTYWYFYGSRLYKEDPPPKKEISKEEKRQQDRQRKRELEKKRREEKKQKKLEKQKSRAMEKIKKTVKVTERETEEVDDSNIRRSGRLRIKKAMKKYESETSDSSSEEETTESSSSATEEEEEIEVEEEDPTPKKPNRNTKKTPAKKTPTKKTPAKKTPAKQQTNKNTQNTSQRQSARQKSQASSRTPRNTSVEDTPDLDSGVRRSGRLRNRHQAVTTPAKYDSSTEEETKDDSDSGNESGITDDDDDTKSETSKMSVKSTVSKTSQQTPVSKRITLPRASANIGKHSTEEDNDDAEEDGEAEENEKEKHQDNNGIEKESHNEKVQDTDENSQDVSENTSEDKNIQAEKKAENKAVNQGNEKSNNLPKENPTEDNVSISPTEALDNENKAHEEITTEIKSQDSEMEVGETSDKVDDNAKTSQESTESHLNVNIGCKDNNTEVRDKDNVSPVEEATEVIEQNENSNNCHSGSLLNNEVKLMDQNHTNLETEMQTDITDSVESLECQRKNETFMSDNKESLEKSEMEIDSENKLEPAENKSIDKIKPEQEINQDPTEDETKNHANGSVDNITADKDKADNTDENKDVNEDIKSEIEDIKNENVEDQENVSEAKEPINTNKTENSEIEVKVEDMEEEKDNQENADEDSKDNLQEKEASGPKTTLGTQKQFVNPVPPTPSKSDTRWHLVCSTLDDWVNLAEWFSNSQVRCEKMLVKLIKDDFLPVLPEIIEAREAERRKRLQELELRRSNRITQKMKEKMEQEKILAAALILEEKERLREEEEKRLKEEQQKLEEENRLREERVKAREERAKRLSMREERARLLAEGKEIPPELLYTATNKYNDDYDSDDSRNDLKSDEDYHNLTRVIEAMKIHKDCWPFLDPVTDEVAPGYSDAIKRPMDLATIEDKVKKRDYKSTQHFLSDFRLMFNNCKRFNGPESEFTECAKTMEQVLKKYKKRFLMDEPGENSYYRDRDFAPHVKGAKTGDKKYRPRRAASSKAMETVQKALNSSEEEEDNNDEDEDLEPLNKRKKTAEFPAKVASHQSLLLQEMIAMKRQREKNLAASALENHKVITRGPERIRVQNPQGGVTIMSKDQLPNTGILQLAATREIKRKVTPQLNSMVDMSKKDPSLSVTANPGHPARNLSAGKTIRIVAPPAQTVIGGNVVRNTAETVKVSSDGYLIIGGKNSGIKISENTKIVIQPPGKPPPQTPPTQGTELVVKKIPTPSGMTELSSSGGLRPINSTGPGTPGVKPGTPRTPTILSASSSPAGIQPQGTQHQIINQGLNSSSGIVTQGGTSIQAKPLNQVMLNQKQRMVIQRQLQQQQNGVGSQSTPPKIIKLATQTPVRTQSSHMSIEDRLRDASIDQVSAKVVKSVNIAGDILDSYYSVFNSAKTSASVTVPVVKQIVSQQMNKPNQTVNTVNLPINTVKNVVNQSIRVVNQPVNVVNESVRVVNQPVNTLNQPVNTLNQPVNTLNQPVNTVNLSLPVNVANQSVGVVNQPVNTLNQTVTLVNQPNNTINQTIRMNQITASNPSLNAILTTQLSKENLPAQGVQNVSVTYTPSQTVRFPSQNQPVVSPDIKSLLLKTVMSDQTRTISPSVIQAKSSTGTVSQVPKQTLVNVNTQPTVQTNTNTPQNVIVQQLTGVNQPTQNSVNINSRIPIQGAINLNEQNQVSAVEQSLRLNLQQPIQNVNLGGSNVSNSSLKMSPIEALLTANSASNVSVNPPNNLQNPTGQQVVSTAISSPSIASIMRQELLKPTSSNARQSLFDMFTSQNKATVNDSIVVGSNQDTDKTGNQGQPTSEPINHQGLLPSSEMLSGAQEPASGNVNFGSPLKTMSIMEALKSKLAQPNRQDAQQATNSQSFTENKMSLCDTVASTSSCVPANPIVCSELTSCSIPASLSHITSSHFISSLTEHHQLNSESQLDDNYAMGGRFTLETQESDYIETAIRLNIDQNEMEITGENTNETGYYDKRIEANIPSNQSGFDGDIAEYNHSKAGPTDISTDIETESLKTKELVKEMDNVMAVTQDNVVVSPGRYSFEDIVHHVENNKPDTAGVIKTRVHKVFEPGTIVTDGKMKKKCRKRKTTKAKDSPVKKNVYVITIPNARIRPSTGTIEKIDSRSLQPDNLDEEIDDQSMASNNDSIGSPLTSTQTACGQLRKVHYGSRSDFNLYEETRKHAQSSIKPSMSAPELTDEYKNVQHNKVENRDGGGVDIEHNLIKLRFKHKLSRFKTNPVKTYQLCAKSNTDETLSTPKCLSMKDIQVKHEDLWKLNYGKQRKCKKQSKNKTVDTQSCRPDKFKQDSEAGYQHQSRNLDEESINSSLTCDEEFFSTDVLSNLFPDNLGDGDSDTETVINHIELFDLQDAQQNLGQQQQNYTAGPPQQTPYAYANIRAASGLKPIKTIGHYENPTQWIRQNVGQNAPLISREPKNTLEQTQFVGGTQVMLMNKQSPQVMSWNFLSHLQDAQSPNHFQKHTQAISRQPNVASPVYAGGENDKLLYLNVSDTGGHQVMLPDVSSEVAANMEVETCSDTGANSLGIGTNNLGIGTNNLGFGANNLGIGTNNLGIGTNNLGIGTNNLGWSAQHNMTLTQKDDPTS